MSDDELTAGLAARRALVVHFSHHANMREGGRFPDDLRAAIANRALWALSCCVLWPGHQMDLPGSVGVIFRPRVVNVLSASNSDSGSSIARDGSESSAGFPLTHETFARTFEVLGSYNEWRVRGADVAGIFVADPSNILVKKEVEVSGGPDIIRDFGMQPIRLDEVLDTFSSLPVFSMSRTRMVTIRA